mmetsp:Transcript_110250/g.246390  ORF Transcript_110250/g.246390 Transcript_110250/m.246390 type:complete len:153 (+) Transcript_110250:617-1075(+)
MKHCGHGSWSFLRTGEFSKTGRHFMDILEPLLGKLIREALPGLPRRHRAQATFAAMEKGAVADLPQPAAAKWIFVGLGWDLSACSGFNLAAVPFDSAGQDMALVSAEHTEEYGLRHGGDGFLGAGIMVDLNAIPEKVSQIFLIGHLAEGHIA